MAERTKLDDATDLQTKVAQAIRSAVEAFPTGFMLDDGSDEGREHTLGEYVAGTHWGASEAAELFEATSAVAAQAAIAVVLAELKSEVWALSTDIESALVKSRKLFVDMHAQSPDA
jgi:hypothetical protein